MHSFNEERGGSNNKNSEKIDRIDALVTILWPFIGDGVTDQCLSRKIARLVPKGLTPTLALTLALKSHLYESLDQSKWYSFPDYRDT
ncbi:hypothetical protein, partial [Bartonella sp. CL32QHWL-2]|uniref:hypothetical protein n=1 Tax=Bartonella sp. CL32QHWL-2 TaxID=3243525 RepID=UPI0035D026B6